MNYDLKIIKNKYGEKMMHLCRELFPIILEDEGFLSRLLLDNFYPSRDLFEDIKDSGNIDSFKNYIYSLIDLEENKIKTSLEPKELLESVGYNLYECRSEADIQKFRKYYKKGEELCTFKDGDRLNRCHVFFAVKENVDEIKREDFSAPEREDLYGTSVISIQFTKGEVNTLSIKNRYNHTVTNPDNTFLNNLENIVPGLTDSFERKYKLDINQNDDGFELPKYVKANDGKYYKYNYEIDNIYYCPDNIIIDNFNVKKYDEEKYLVIDYFILDLVNKKIILYDNSIMESFTPGITNINKISIIKDKETGDKKIEIRTLDNNLIIIEIDKQNNIIGYKNNNLKKVGSNFLYYNKKLKKLSLPNLEECRNSFLASNKELVELNLPNLEECGSDFLFDNKGLTKLYLPKLKEADHRFLVNCESLYELDLRNLEEVGDKFLRFNKGITSLNLSSLKKAGDRFIEYNPYIKELYMPSLKEVGDSFLSSCELRRIELNNLEVCGDDFLSCNNNLYDLKLPKLISCGNRFLCRNLHMKKLSLPNLKIISDDFFARNNELISIDLPKLEEVGNNFLYHNDTLKELNLPSLKKCYDKFLYKNKGLISLILPKLEIAGDNFLEGNLSLRKLDLPNLLRCGHYFLGSSLSINSINLPNLKSAGCGFLYSNISLKEVNLPELRIVGNIFLRDNFIIKEVILPKLTSVGIKFLDSAENLINIVIPNIKYVYSDFLQSSKNINRFKLLKDCEEIKDVGDYDTKMLFYSYIIRIKRIKKLLKQNIKDFIFGFIKKERKEEKQK